MTSELLTDPHHTRGDLKMVRTAIRRGYNIPDELLDALPKIAGAIMLDRNEKASVRLKAIDTIMAMKESNDVAEGIDKPQDTTPSVVNFGVHVANVSDTGRSLASEILARLGTHGVSAVAAGGNAG